MIKQTLVSDTLDYFRSCASGASGGLLGDNYHSEYCTPPRMWRDSIANLLFMFVRKEEGVGYDSVIHVNAMLNTTLWPSWRSARWRISASDGRLLSAEYTPQFDNIWGVGAAKSVMSRSGYLYGFITFLGLGGEWNRYYYNPDSGLLQFVDTMGNALPSSVDAIDEVLNLALGPGFSFVGSGGEYNLVVYNLTTGAIVRTIYVGGNVANVMLEDFGRAYVVLTDGRIVLVNYENGEVYSVTKVNRTFDYIGEGEKFAYDPSRKRLLFCQPTPNATDGQSTTRIYGYTDLPVPTKLSPPIPLAKPRVGRRIRVLTQIIGDAGESYAQGTVRGSLSNANGMLVNGYALPDFNGNAIFEIDCKTAGPVVMDVEADIGDMS